jgi:predicted RND superfamily exporter protein
LLRSYDPLGFSRLSGLSGRRGENPDPMVSTDRTFQIFYVEGEGVDFSSYRDAGAWLKKIQATVADWRASEAGLNVEIGLTGTPAFMAEVGARMERDMTISAAATMILISILFWIMHRQSKPLSWLVSAMMLTLSITLIIGGQLLGNLSVMSAGFAAILLGLAVDYGIVLYRHGLVKKLDAKGLRKAIGPSICWAAATTAVVFLSLNFSSLPGLAEMGNLVAVGVIVGALVMLFFFAPVAGEFAAKDKSSEGANLPDFGISSAWTGRLAASIPVLALLSILLIDVPRLEAEFHPFRIRESPSMVTWRKMQDKLRGEENSVPAIVTAGSLNELNANLAALERRTKAATEAGLIERSLFPLELIPNPAHQLVNASRIQKLSHERDRLIAEMKNAGFTKDGQKLTALVFDSWASYLDELSKNGVAHPSGRMAEWTIGRLYAESDDGRFAALASIKPADAAQRDWVEAICNENAVVASLSSLGTALNQRIQADLGRIFIPMTVLLTLMLAFVFRNWRDLVLSLFSLLFAASFIVILTLWTPLSWNSFNLFGVPILFGTGLDFSIHMIYALRRYHGDGKRARQTIGKALVFCGLSSAIGFGSLAFASAQGLSSLGVVCATGILVNLFVAVWLLPSWYRWIHKMSNKPKTKPRK